MDEEGEEAPKKRLKKKKHRKIDKDELALLEENLGMRIERDHQDHRKRLKPSSQALPSKARDITLTMTIVPSKARDITLTMTIMPSKARDTTINECLSTDQRHLQCWSQTHPYMPVVVKSVL